jgi:hypothetical protein
VTFGDHDQADTFDTARPDPEQVARRLHQYRRDEGLEAVGWDDLAPPLRARLVLVAAAVVAWLARSGPVG